MTATQTQEQDSSEGLKRMSFGDHLDELRRRLGRSMIAIAVCVFGMIPFKTEITSVYAAPYRNMWMKGFVEYLEDFEEEVRSKGGADNLHESKREAFDWLQKYEDEIKEGQFPEDQAHKIRDIGGYRVPYFLVSLSGLADFWTFMAASVLFALILASPYVLFQMWAFVAAGLYRQERGVVYRSLPWAFVLLALGVGFGYFGVVPYGLFYLVKLMNFGQVQPMLSVNQYFSLLFTLTAALGIVFQLPLLMMALTKVGLVRHEGWKKNWRYVILGMVVVSAMFTPPDPFTQVMMATPMCLLYLVGLFFTRRIDAKVSERAEGA